MDDKIYRGPGHPVGAHFHSGPKGERGLPGVSPKVDMTYNEDDGTVVFTVTDGYGQREQTVPVSERIDEWTDEHGHEAIDAWLDDHPEATTTVQDDSLTTAKYQNGSVTEDKLSANVKIADYLVDIFRPYPTFTIPRTQHTGTNDYYSVQGCCVTSDSIIIAEVADDSTNLNIKLSKISQLDYSITNSEERTLSSANHMNCLTYFSDDDEVWACGTGNTAYIIDADTLGYKRNETIPFASNAVGYDAKSNLWMFTKFTSNQYTIYLYARDGVGTWTEVKHFTIPRMSTTQGATFHDRMIYLVFSENGSQNSYQSLINANYSGMQNIVVVDVNGMIHKSWWLDSGYVELEDCDILNDGRMIISSNCKLGDESAYTIYTGIFRPLGNTETLTSRDRDMYYQSFWLYPYYKIKSNDSHLDLNNKFYLQPFTYSASNAVASSLTNAPVSVAFKMTVESALSLYGGLNIDEGYQYIRRTLVTLSDDVYVQYCNSNSSGTWTFGQWVKQPRPYKAGEIIANADYFVHGFVTGSGREVNLIFALGNSIENISSATCEYCRCAVRTVEGGYLGGSTNIDLTSYVTLVTLHKEQNAIAVRLWNDDGWGITNNTPLAGMARGRFVLS